MPLATLKIAPGVNSEITDAQGMAQIVDCDLIRFKYAGNQVLPEKLGGWNRFYPTSLGSIARDLHAWEGINNDTHLAAGCLQSLTIISDGVAEDVTPQTYTSTIAPAFTTNSTTLVQIDDTNITTSVFDSIYIVTPVSIGGIVLQGAYRVNTVLDSDSYTIIAATAATSTTGPGGAVPVFTTTAGSAFVSVALDDHGYQVGQTFGAGVSTAVGGITIFGAYLVQSVTDVDNFVIIAADEAASNDSESMNGGDAEIIYFISGGPPPTSVGYGVAGYGDGAYGTGSSIPGSGGTPITATNWTLDNWGEVLIATPADQSIYTWSPDSGFPNATKIVGAPLVNGGAFVAQPAQIVVAWAASTGGVQDPLAVIWSDAGNYNQWTVSSQTQAGGYRFPTGSRIVGGMAGPQFGIIWTDLEPWSMDYIGPPFIFGFNSLASNCGLISRHGYGVLNETVYWMSDGKFCELVGESVRTIPCSVWDFIFQDLDEDNVDKIFCGTNSLFGEVTWYFPSESGGTGEVDKFVKFTPDLGTWDHGSLPRSAWIDKSPVGKPVGADPTNFVLYQHETSPDADGQPLVSWLQTGFYQVADGQELQFIDWVFPDFKYGYVEGSQSAIVQMTFTYTDYPNEAVKTGGPFNFSNTTKFVNPRLRGRYVAAKFESNDLGSWWRLGDVKVRSKPDGTR